MLSTSGGGQAWGFRWTGTANAGVLPEYFKEQNGAWTAVSAAAVPGETWLVDQTFPGAARGAASDLDLSGNSPWASSHWSAGPFTVTLADGSIVDYVWYKFIDQPAIVRLGLSASTRAQLQTLVESMHAQFGVNGLTIASPTSGKLVTVDPAQLVAPPTGMEKGYVPIVIRQR